MFSIEGESEGEACFFSERQGFLRGRGRAGVSEGGRGFQEMIARQLGVVRERYVGISDLEGEGKGVRKEEASMAGYVASEVGAKLPY